MIRFYRSGKEDIASLVGLRAEMLREVNSLPEDHEFTASFIRDTESFLRLPRVSRRNTRTQNFMWSGGMKKTNIKKE